MKFVKLIGALFFVISTHSQESFYQQLEDNGPEAIYATFYRKTNANTEVFSAGKQGEEINITIIKVNNISIGFEARSAKTGKWLFGFNEVENYGRTDHYPITKMIKHKYDSEAYAMVDGSMYKFGAVKDKVLKAQNIWQAFVLKRKAITPMKKPKEKKDFFRKFKKLRVGGKISSEKEYLNKINLKKMVDDYDKYMTVKQQSYQLNVKDKSEIAKIKGFRKSKKDYIKRYNDSVYNTPEYQKMLTHQKRMRAMDSKKSKQIVTIINNTGKTIYVFEEGSRNSIRLGNSYSRSFPCNKNGYYSTVSNSNINGNGRLFYKANSSCSSTVTIK